MKKHQTGGLVDSEGRPVRDGSGNPIMTGSGNQAAKDEAQTEARMEAARKKLAGEVQTMVKAKGDADRLDVDAKQGAMAPAKAAAPAKRAAPVVTKEQLAKSGLSLRDYMNKQQGLTRRGGTAPAGKTKTASEYSDSTNAMRNRSRMAANPANKKSSTTDALRSRSRKEAAFEGAKRTAKTPEGQARRAEQTREQAVKRVTPEEYIGPGAGLKALNQAAKNLAKPKVREYNPTMLPAPKAAAKPETKSLPAPQQKLSYDKRGIKDKERSDRATAREKQKDSDNIQRGGRLTGGRDIELKKGGSVSSASKRADGIAQRGKTRGKVY